jgi:hypothetical protein
MAALINAAVADLAAGRLDLSSKRLDDAAAAAASAPTLYPVPPPHFLTMAINYNKALVLAAAKGEEGRKQAIELLQRNYLTQADPSSAWWTLAYEQYEKLCREQGIEPKSKQELQRRRSAQWRPVTSVKLSSGKSIDLLREVEELVAELGDATRVPVTPNTKLEKLSYPDLGVELLATSELLVIRVMGDNEASVELRGTGLGTERHTVQIGTDKAELERLIEKQFPSQGLAMKHSLRVDGVDAVYRWYPNLGLAVLFKDGKVSELVIVPVSRA